MSDRELIDLMCTVLEELLKRRNQVKPNDTQSSKYEPTILAARDILENGLLNQKQKNFITGVVKFYETNNYLSDSQFNNLSNTIDGINNVQ